MVGLGIPLGWLVFAKRISMKSEQSRLNTGVKCLNVYNISNLL